MCELKEAQIRDGLHILGQCPQGQQLRDLIVAIARHPSNKRLGLTSTRSLKDLGLDFNPLTANPSDKLSQPPRTNSSDATSRGFVLARN